MLCGKRRDSREKRTVEPKSEHRNNEKPLHTDDSFALNFQLFFHGIIITVLLLLFFLWVRVLLLLFCNFDLT